VIPAQETTVVRTSQKTGFRLILLQKDGAPCLVGHDTVVVNDEDGMILITWREAVREMKTGLTPASAVSDGSILLSIGSIYTALLTGCFS